MIFKLSSPSQFIKQLQLGPAENFTYLVCDTDAGLAAVIDPGWEAASIINEAHNLGVDISKVLLTHHHFDHTTALPNLLNECNADVYMNTDEISYYTFNSKNLIPITPDDIIRVGGIEIKNILTPGHTKGSTCFLVENYLMTGDTLFIDACGRCDLPGGSADELMNSLQSLITRFSPETVVLPGHDYGDTTTATLADQIKTNPYLRVEEKPQDYFDN